MYADADVFTSRHRRPRPNDGTNEERTRVFHRTRAHLLAESERIKRRGHIVTAAQFAAMKAATEHRCPICGRGERQCWGGLILTLRGGRANEDDG